MYPHLFMWFPLATLLHPAYITDTLPQIYIKLALLICLMNLSVAFATIGYLSV